MKTAMSVLVVMSLSAFYLFGLVYAIGFFAGIEFPWQPLNGKPALSVYALEAIPHFFATLTVALVVALGLALRFRDRPFIFGLVVATPTALTGPASTWLMAPIVSPSLALVAVLLKDFVLTLFAPAILAVVLVRFFSGNRLKPSAPSSLGPSSSAA